MPALFIGHGSPMNTLELNRHTHAWRAAAAHLPRPRAVLCLSAHWQTAGGRITAQAAPRTIHDFSGFPPELFAVNYPAPGAPALAADICRRWPEWQADMDWGLDHGAWSVLVHLFPQAEVPVLQLSLDTGLDLPGHWARAQRLAALRDEGVLILGSGNGVHNLGRLRWEPPTTAAEWALRHERSLRTALEQRDDATLLAGAALNADARLAIPTDEHYLPLLYIAALRGAEEPLTVITEGIELGSIGMLAFQVGAA